MKTINLVSTYRGSDDVYDFASINFLFLHCGGDASGNQKDGAISHAMSRELLRMCQTPVFHWLRSNVTHDSCELGRLSEWRLTMPSAALALKTPNQGLSM